MRSQFVDWLNDTEKHFPPGMVSRLVTFRGGALLRLVLAVKPRAHFCWSRKLSHVLLLVSHCCWSRKLLCCWSRESRIPVGCWSRKPYLCWSREPHFCWSRKPHSDVLVSHFCLVLGSRVSVGLGSPGAVGLALLLGVSLGSRSAQCCCGLASIAVDLGSCIAVVGLGSRISVGSSFFFPRAE
jgi:hypothetical protein